MRTWTDSRFDGRCIFCGGLTENRDHVPSKVFLDPPYPENLPVVESCIECNSGFSLDEEYLAALVECVIAGSTNPSDLARKTVGRSLAHSDGLRARLSKAMTDSGAGVSFDVEEERVDNVATKLLMGHRRYETGIRGEKPQRIRARVRSLMTDPELAHWESFIETDTPSAEVGSRLMQKQYFAQGQALSWEEVQDQRYRYIVSIDGSTVRAVIREFLYLEGVW